MLTNLYRILLISLVIFGISLRAEAEEGLISAVAFKPIPTATIAVKAWDNSDENMKTAKVIEAKLKSLGYTISSNAKLTLFFETKNELGKWSGPSTHNSVELKAENSSATGNDAEVKLNLFSSSDGGILNPSKKAGENILSRASLEIILDQRNGPRLWQGEAAAGVHQTDSASVARRLVPFLLDELGKTIRQKTINIP